MKGKKSVYWGIRFSKEEVEQINTFRNGMRLNKSEVVRLLIQRAISIEKKEEISDFQKELQAIYRVNRYIAGLLTALVRKGAKNNLSDAEKMIQAARFEAEKNH